MTIKFPHQETVSQTLNEKKLQRMLLVKSKLPKPTNRTKKAYREASAILTPSEQLALLFGHNDQEEREVSSCSEMDSSMDMVDKNKVIDALVAKNI